MQGSILWLPCCNNAWFIMNITSYRKHTGSRRDRQCLSCFLSLSLQNTEWKGTLSALSPQISTATAPECRRSYFGWVSRQLGLRASFKDKFITLKIKNEINCIYLRQIKLAFTFNLLRHQILARRKYSMELFKIQLRKEAFLETSISEIVNSEYSRWWEGTKKLQLGMGYNSSWDIC